MDLPPDALTILADFVRDRVAEADAAGVMVGLSGGLDSATALTLAVRALGPAAVHGLLLPCGATPSTALARDHAAALGVETTLVDIAPLVAAMQCATDDADGGAGANWFATPVAGGNLRARLRMTLLYGAAAAHGALVLGTSNKSELLVGYFTKWGDGGVDCEPLGDLYKTQVRALAAALEVPATIRERVPTAELWEGQTDEGELGLEYATLDRVLAALERKLPTARVAEVADVAPATVAHVQRLIARSVHKRLFPLVCKLGVRTIGVDWREAPGGMP